MSLNVDLNNTSEYDKTVIYLDSRNSDSNNDNDTDFYVKFNEPLKNVFATKLEYVTIVSNVLGSYQDIYFVQINNFERSTSYIKYEDSVGNGNGSSAGSDFNIVKYFEALPYTGTVYSGGVYFVKIVNGGIGYTKNAIVDFGDPPDGGIKPTATVKVDATGKITHIIMTKVGYGYITAPVISVSDTGGTDFQGTPIINNYISKVSHTLGATNFSDPTVHVLNPPEPNLTRFQISVRDKYFKKIERNDINYINLSICIYSIKKNVLYK